VGRIFGGQCMDQNILATRKEILGPPFSEGFFDSACVNHLQILRTTLDAVINDRNK
jgi:hypothetical protein